MRRGTRVGVWVALSMTALNCTTRSSGPPTSGASRLDDAKDAGATDAEASIQAGSDSQASAATEGTFPKLDTRFYTVARGELRLAPLQNTMFVHDFLGVARLVGRDLRREAELHEVASDCTQWVTTLQGRWPDAAYMAKHESLQTEKSFPGALLYRWKGDRWVALHPNKEQFTWYTNLVPWGAGAVAGAIRREIGYRGYQLTIAEPRVTAPFAPTSATTTQGSCAASLDGTTIAAARDSLFVAGLLCPTKAPAVETFERGRRTGTLTSLPRPDGATITVNAIHARAPDDVFVGGGRRPTDGSSAAKPYMAHFDGTRWELQDVPTEGEITSIDAERDGLWLTSGGKLWKLSAGSWTKSCDTVYLEVVAAPDAAGADYAYPEVAALVKSTPTLWHDTRLIETATGGRLYLGARVADYATGVKLEALVRKHLTGSKPRLLCAAPPLMRDLHELVTGAASTM